jgi:[NiFe] hydrogenase assembly HybE family chaperone
VHERLAGAGQRSRNWQSTGDNRRRFVKFPAGDFAFLGSTAAELGEYQSCSLFSPMGQFANQSEAIMTARASLVALLTDPATAAAAAPPPPPPSGQPSLSRRRFLAMR